MPPDEQGWSALLAVGVIASVVMEWLARVLSLWSYSDLMPTLTLFGHTVGLSPVIQITLLPALGLYVTTRGRS